MKRLRIILLLFIPAFPTFAQNSGFVEVKGTQFYVDGKPYYFLGTNVWYGCMLGQSGEAGNRKRLRAELDHLQKLGIDNVRVMGASEGLGLQGQIKPAIQPRPGEHDEALLVGLDFLLAEMAKRKMYAIVFLNNYWEWTGGMSQYMCWVTGDEYPNPFNPKFGYRALMLCSGRFYTNTEANELYRNYLRVLVNRKNAINGRLYKDDPTIMAWQLGNEPRPNPEEQNREQHFQEFIRWVDETASYIKSLDPKHLVCTGNEGLAGTLWSEPCYKESHKSKNIDYMTFHLWVLNWRWYDPLKPEETYPEAERKALNYLQQHIAFAQELGKPVTLEEFGIPRDRHDYSPKAPTIYRDRYYTALFDARYQSARTGSAMAGSNFWTWGGEGKARDQTTFIWQEGDSYTGDPPQEPQGRNSVFASDKSTLKIIRKYARLMRQLGGDH